MRLSDARLLYWWLLVVLGFAYVAMVLCGRSSPFESDNNAWGDWLAVFLSAPGLHFLTIIHTLRPFREKGALLWNILGFGFPFFAALHWKWVGRLAHAHFSLTARQISHLHGPSFWAFIAGIIGFVAIALLCIQQARRKRILRPYLFSFAGLTAVIALVTWLLGPGYYLHIHHYFLAFCLLPFVRFRHPVCLVTQAMLAGVYVEGACRFGIDPVWIARR